MKIELDDAFIMVLSSQENLGMQFITEFILRLEKFMPIQKSYALLEYGVRR